MTTPLKPITLEYWLATNGNLYARGRQTISPGAPPPTVHSTARIHAISATASGSVITPPDPPPIVPGTRNATAGALAPGAQTYPVPTSGAVLFVSTTGNDANAGTQAAPLRTITRAMGLIPTAGTVVARGGSYNEGGTPGTTEGGIAVTRNDITLMAYPGEAVWLEGSVPFTGFVADTTAKPGSTIYRAPYTLRFETSVQFGKGTVDGTQVGYVWLNSADATGKAANTYDQVFLIDSAGVQTVLLPVSTPGEVVPGKFCVVGPLVGGTGTDRMVRNATTLYIGNNPASYAEVRVSNKTVALTVAGSSPSDNNLGRGFTMLGIWARRYGPANCDGGVIRFNRSFCTAENVGILDSPSVGFSSFLGTRPGGSTLRHVTLQRHGLNCAHYQQSDAIVIDDCLITNSNTHNWMMAPAAGGVKITACIGGKVRRTIFRDHNADGFWCDASVFDFDVITCDAVNNRGHGFEYEISAKARFIDCLGVNNSKDCFLNRCSDAVEFWYCTATGAGEVPIDATQDNRATVNGPVTGIFGQDSRKSGKDDPVYGSIGMYWWVKNYKVRNCVIVKPSAGAGALRIRTQSVTRTLASFGPDVDSNLYGRINASVPTIGWTLITTGYSTFALYKAAGTAAGVTLDAHGLNQDGHDPINADYTLKTADDTAANAIVQPMPADIAALLGRAAGTIHCGAFL